MKVPRCEEITFKSDCKSIKFFENNPVKTIPFPDEDTQVTSWPGKSARPRMTSIENVVCYNWLVGKNDKARRFQIKQCRKWFLCWIVKWNNWKLPCWCVNPMISNFYFSYSYFDLGTRDPCTGLSIEAGCRVRNVSQEVGTANHTAVQIHAISILLTSPTVLASFVSSRKKESLLENASIELIGLSISL